MADTTADISPLSRFIPTLAPTNYSEQFKREIYARFHRLILRPKCARMWGFPYVDDEDDRVKFNSSRFSKAGKSDRTETCRCGKSLFLAKEDWYLAGEGGCEFHPGKFLYSESARTEIYTCCKGDWSTPGCVRREHHVSSHRACSGEDFVRTAPKKTRLLPHLPNIFALDCEMVYTTRGMEVAKVTVLTVFCDVVYDAFVRPRHPVIDHNTEFSGVDASHLAPGPDVVDLQQVQSDLLKVFDTRTILVGHGLENDLLCLGLHHGKVIDTSVLYSHRMGFPYRHSLKQLAMTYLGKTIHSDPKRGHDSREDARTCIELVALKIFVSKTKGNRTNPVDLQSQMAANLIPNSIPRNKVYGPPSYGYVPAYPPPVPNCNQFVNLPQQHPLLSYPLVSMNMPKRQHKKLLIPLP